MPIESIHISRFRNLPEIAIQCAPRFNLFFGENGAGKTSILEAIYYLSLSKSFRTSHIDRLVLEDYDDFVIFTKLRHDNTTIPIGVQKYRDSRVVAHINQESIKSTAEISRYLPIQFIGSDSHRVLTDGPKVRRQFLDWGLFYTNSEFFTIWKQFNKTLNHRNAALKARAPLSELKVWNQQFSDFAETLHSFRQSYIDSLTPFFLKIIHSLLETNQISLIYSPGWNIEQNSLSLLLETNLYKEMQVGHSLFGPHRADLILQEGKIPAYDVLSQGQQKLVSYALRLAQGMHFQSITGQAPIYLIDDLPSELDPQKRKLVTTILQEIDAQVFITGILEADLHEIMALSTQNHMFHVKHGRISKC